MAHLQYMPGDPRLVDQLVYELKSKGIFDQFRKECIADVDTRPAYQNLRQRVESSVATFLARQCWKPDLNKNQLREKLRKHILDGNYLEQGVERIVDQVVNPKVASVFIPQVEDLVYNYLGITRKKTPVESPEKTVDLLPTDLEAVSPGSVKSNNDKEDVSMDIDSNTAEKMDLDTDKAKEEVKIIEDKKDCQNTEILSSNEFDVNVDRSCIPLPSEEIKLENIPEPENSPPKASEVELEKIALPKEQVPSTDIPLPEEIIQTESNFKPMLLQSEDSNSSSGSSLRRNMSPLTPIRNYNNENSCDAQQAFETDAKINDKEPSSFRFTIEAENSQDQTDNKKKEPEQSDLAYQFNNQVNINSFNTPLYDESSNSNNLRIDYESDANSKAMVDTKPESENTEERKEKKDDKKSQKSSHRSRDSHRHSSTKDKRSDSKHSNSRDGSKHERKSLNKDDHKKSNKDSRDRSKDRSDKKENRESTKHRSSKSSSHKESKSHRSSSSSQRHSSKTSDDKKISSSSHKEKEKESKDKSSKDRSKDSRSSSHKSEKDRKSSSSSKKSDEKDKKKDKKDIDDHYSSSGRGNHGRRSTDRDSNDGSSSSKGSNNQNGSKSSDKKSSSKSSSSKSDNTSTTSGDTSSPSDKDQKLQINQLSQFKPAVRVDNHLETPIATPPRLPFVPDITLKKPKFAANLAEARQMMKMRKFLDEEQKRMNQEAALLLEFQANVRPSLSQVYSSIPGPELEFACGDNTIVNPSQSTIESVNENLDNSDESTDHKDEIQPEPQSVQQIFDIILGNPSEIEISDQRNIETYDENKPFSKLVEEISEYSKASENKVKLDKTNEQPEESKQEDNDTNAAEYFEVTADNVSESGNEEKMDIDEVKIEINEKEIDEEIESPPFEDITENPDVTESKIEIPDYTKNKLAINLIEVKENKKEFVEEKESLKTREIAENVEIPEVDKNTKSIVKDIKEISEDTIEESIENIKECLEKDNVVVKTKDEDIIPDQSQEHLDQEETKKISSNENVILESVTNNTKNEKKIPEIIPINANKSEKIPEILPIKTSKEKKVSKNISKEKKVPDNVPINIVKEKIIPETVQENTNKNIKSLEIVPLNANKEKIITEIIPINVNNEKKVPEIVPDNTINEKKVQEIISLNITKEKIPQIVPLNANKDKENPETAPLKDNPEILQLSSNKDSRSIKPVIELEIDIEDELKVHTILKYFTNEEKITAQSDSEKFTKFFKSYTEFTSKLHLINCDTYEENIIKEVAKNFGDYEIVNYFKNGHTKVPKKSKNIVKDIRLSQEVTLPTKTIFSPTKSECSFELSSDYDAKLDEIVNKKSRQEVMEIILGGVIEDNPKTTNETTKTSNKSTNNSKESTNNSKESTNNSNESTKTSNEGRTLNDNESGDEKNLKRKGKVESSVNDKRSILTPTKLRKLSDSDQISSTTEEAEEMSSNNNKVQITTRSKYLGRAKRVGLSRPKRCNLVNSPSSDKSIENYVQNTPPAAVNGKMKPTPRSKVQRYDTSDLYKPKLPSNTPSLPTTKTLPKKQFLSKSVSMEKYFSFMVTFTNWKKSRLCAWQHYALPSFPTSFSHLSGLVECGVFFCGQILPLFLSEFYVMAKTQKNKHKSRIRQRKSRRVIGSRGYKNYSEEMLQLACEAVSSNQISSRDAERQFGIPRRTIVKKIKKLHSKSVGHPTHLTEEEENRIVRVLQASSDFGYPLTKLDLKLIVSEYLKKNSREHLFKNKIPGDAWVQSFLARHADTLSVRMTQNISKARAEKGPQEIADYFANLSITLKDIPATNIINFDETNLSDDPGSSKCIFRRGVRYPERIANSTKGNISVMFTAIASGQSLPLYVVYKATNLYSEWITGGPPSTRYNFTKSGWFDSATFEDYFEKIIIPWAHETPGTKVVICDNLSSHLSVKVIELCDQYNIKFVFIPPRSTHLTQPLDVTYFGPLKKAWRRILYQYKLKNPNQTSLNKKHFPKLLTELIEAIMLNKDKNIKSGFKATGIFPLNPQEVLIKLPEMQEDILSYGLDQTLIEYLKETRAPKPMAVKRNKKVKCEPGKSVTAADLHIIKICSKKGTLKSNGNKQNKNNLPEVIITQNQSVLNLDDQTGIFTNNNLSPNYINTDRDQNFEIQNLNDLILFNNYNGFQPLEEININSEKSNWPNVYEHSTLTLKSPKTLIQYCIEALNSVLYQSMTQVPEPKLLSKINDNFPNYTRQIEPTAGTSGVFIKKTKPKINIISNVLIKTATQTSDVHYLSDVSNLEINTPFIVKANRGLPKCLQQGKPTKSEKTNNLNKSNPKRMRINSKNKLQNSKGGKKKKLKKKQSICDSSSTSANSTIKLIDTDDSDCETLQSYYISECLKDQEEKENFEDTEIPFGLSDIQYLDDRGELNEGNWIVARFATKKSLKHFVGKILSVSDKKPMVKFVRKVKQSKCDKGTSFTYPTVDDVCIIHYLEDVISVLPEPTISRRGQIIFNVDFSNLNIQ